VSDGVKVSDWGTWIKDAVNIGRDNTVTFVTRPKEDPTGYMTTPNVELYNALSGNARLLRDGVVLPGKGGDTTYPQAAVGHTADHRLILFVSDGRQPGFSEGMTYEEVAVVLKEFGAVDAIAFDGGGSATMVMADGKDGEPRVLNRPSDGQERAVGNNLGVIIGDEGEPAAGQAENLSVFRAFGQRSLPRRRMRRDGQNRHAATPLRDGVVEHGPDVCAERELQGDGSPGRAEQRHLSPFTLPDAPRPRQARLIMRVYVHIDQWGVMWDASADGSRQTAGTGRRREVLR
jgi:hypothetical protein